MKVSVEILWREVLVDVDDWQVVVAGDEDTIVTADDAGHVDAPANTTQTRHQWRHMR